MPNAKRANDINAVACWKVRICVRRCGIVHVLSRTEPEVTHVDDKITDVALNIITDTEHGDTVGFIDWSEVGAITWRFAPLATA